MIRFFRTDRGFLLVGLVTMMAIFGIMSGTAVQQWSVIELREREAQLLFIQEQYAQAILEYQKDQGGSLPTKLEQLDERGQKNQRFIRRLYVDPMIRGQEEVTVEDWCLLRVGPTGQVTSSCAKEDQRDGLTREGSEFRLGQADNATRAPQQLPGVQPGTQAIAGVHSRVSGKPFNSVKRGEGGYDSWYYTFEDWQREMDTRGYPGLSTGQAETPGTQPRVPGGQRQPGQRQPGTQGGGSRPPGGQRQR